MSDSIGDRLPPPLRFELGNVPQSAQANAALLLSVDESGFVRVALLAATHVEAVDERHLRLRVHPQSQTAKNLQARPNATLWSVLDAAAYSVRGSVRQAPGSGQPDPAEWLTFELEITDVLRDFQPDAPLVSGPTYKRQ